MRAGLLMKTMCVMPRPRFLSFVNLFCTLLETVSIIFVVFIRFFLTPLLHARICGVLAVTKTKHR